MEETKLCPFCGEEVKIVAKKCRHCGEWLDKPEIVTASTQSVKSKSKIDVSALCLCILSGILVSFGFNCIFQIIYYIQGIEVYSFFDTMPWAIVIAAVTLVASVAMMFTNPGTSGAMRLSAAMSTVAIGGVVGVLLVLSKISHVDDNIFDSVYSDAMNGVGMGSIIGFAVLAIIIFGISLKLKSPKVLKYECLAIDLILLMSSIMLFLNIIY